MQLLRIAQPESHTWSLSWHPDGRMLAAAGSDKKIYIYTVDAEFTLSQPFQIITNDFGKTIRSVMFSHNGKMLCAGSFDSVIQVYVRNGTYESYARLEGHESQVKCVSWSPKDTKIATCSRDKNIYVWEENREAGDYLCQNVLQGHTQDIKFVTWLDSSRILSSSYDNTIRLWEYEDDELVQRQILDKHTETVWSIAIHNQKQFVSVSDDCSLKVWTEVAEKFQMSQNIEKLHKRSIFTCDCSGGLVATGAADNQISILQFSQGVLKEKSKILAHESDVNCVKFNPKYNNILASCSDDGFIKIWKIT